MCVIFIFVVYNIGGSRWGITPAGRRGWVGGSSYAWKLYYAALQYGREVGKGVNTEPMFGYCTYKKSYGRKGIKEKSIITGSSNGANMKTCVSMTRYRRGERSQPFNQS